MLGIRYVRTFPRVQSNHVIIGVLKTSNGMQYNIKGTGVQITPELRDYLEKRLRSLDKFANADARVDIELGYQASQEKMYRAEFMFYEPGLHAPLRAQGRGGALHEAIDLAEAELFRELTRVKKKRLHLLRRSAARVKEYLRGWTGR